MADALISAEHFYVNASYYNDTDTNQDAVIHVTDNADIINRDDSWLVHITRFSCDSMATLAYIEKDETATWNIQCYNGNNECTDRYDFVLAKNYATPADLIDDMNLKRRFKRLNPAGAAIYAQWVELYRFELDAGGRFRLVAQPTETPEEHLYINYTGSASMNKLLGFSEASPFLRFAPSVATLFCRAIDFLHAQCSKAEDIYFINGSYHDDVNNCLVYLLNGLATETRVSGGSNPVTTTPDTSTQGFTAGINLLTDFVFNKGPRPTAHNGEHEACLPKTGVPMIHEWFDVRAAANMVDTGPKLAIRQLLWSAAYNPTANVGGIITSQDIPNPNTVQTAGRWPFYNPATNAWSNRRYHYPFDSVPGYHYSGVQGSRLYVTAVVNRKVVELNTGLPSKVEVGDDLWITEPLSPHQTNEPFALVFQIEAMNATRTVITFVDLIGESSYSTSLVGFDVVATDRRVPFQSKSRTYDNIITESQAIVDGENQTTIFMGDPHNGSVGDIVYFVYGQPVTVNAIVAGPYTINGVSSTQQFSYIGPIVSPLHLGAIGNINNNGQVTQFFIKKASDGVRWAKDAVNYKMVPTTFSYENQALHAAEPYDRVRGFSVDYGRRVMQVFDESMLHRQILKFNAELASTHTFHTSNTTNHEYVNEEIDGTTFEILPASAKVLDPATIGGASNNNYLDMGVYPIQVPHGSNFGQILQRYGHGMLPTGLMARLPQPWWGIQAYTSTAGADAVTVVDFVKANPDEKPRLLCTGTGSNFANTVGDLVLVGGISPGEIGGHFAPFVVGVKTLPPYDIDYFMFWTPGLNGGAPNTGTTGTTVLSQAMLDQLSITNGVTRSTYGLLYDPNSRPYALAKKEMSSIAVVANEAVRLDGWGGDHISSSLDSQIDHIFPYRQLIITSDDLQQIPERSQDAASRQPILSSYTLGTMISTSIDSKGAPAGGSSQAFGTVYFSETGARRYHHLIKVGGGMRQFRLHAALTYKDHTKSSKTVELAPGGQFTAQLLFMKKEEV